MKQNLKQSIKTWYQTNIVRFFRFVLARKTTTQKQSKRLKHIDAQGKVSSVQDDAVVTVIVDATVYEDSTLALIDNIKHQTTVASTIWVICQSNEDKAFYDLSNEVDVAFVVNADFAQWQKVALSGLARTDLVLWLDHFMLPQKGWLSATINQLNKKTAIFGASGVIAQQDEHQIVGWDGIKTANFEAVDYVRHATLLPTKTASAFLASVTASDKEQYSPDVLLGVFAQQINIDVLATPFVHSAATDVEHSLYHSRLQFNQTYRQRELRSIADKTSADWPRIKTLLPASKERRSFREELYFFTDKLLNHENFSVIRVGDGEMKIVKGETIKTSRFFYNPGDEKHERNRIILNKSLTFDNPNYFVGVPGRCCVGDDYCDAIIEAAGIPQAQLTWASVFINANYKPFMEVTLKALQGRILNMICFEKARLEHLPFPIKKDFRVGMNAWADDYDKTIAEMADYIETNQVENEVFIFCSGALSNMLICTLTERFPNNTYLDVGSVFDVYFSLGKTRRYLKGNSKQIEHSCVW
ncbi:hypothetical protein [Thalassotalea agarivorans]|uniref:Uncharacterized protein n=1 Tax=Thalassotalea agarivorans TaxID=349064 RepID=A0A1I0E9C0_THASX|nr:hypothetical protein [Thalassotalea agarivorans]SET41303.1 hypothetical protein SAMN05660429_01768 [Thalassotalea agarivorans]